MACAECLGYDLHPLGNLSSLVCSLDSTDAGGSEGQCGGTCADTCPALSPLSSPSLNATSINPVVNEDSCSWTRKWGMYPQIYRHYLHTHHTLVHTHAQICTHAHLHVCTRTMYHSCLHRHTDIWSPFLSAGPLRLPRARLGPPYCP